MSLGFFSIEKAGQAPPGKIVVVTALSLLASMIAVGIILAFYGLNPWSTLDLIITHTLGTAHGWSEVVRRGTPVLLIGLGILVGVEAQFWNLGADGQLLVGAIAASGVALYSGLAGMFLLPVMFVAAILAASCWALVPTLLKAKLGVNEIVTGLMMNYIAANVVDYLVQGPWRGDSFMGYPYTNTFGPNAWLPLIPGTRICWGMTLIGLMMRVVIHFLLFYTPTGCRIRVIGQSQTAARYAGINIGLVFLVVALAAGGMAGLAGVGEIAGVHHKLSGPQQITNGMGFMAVIAAMLARGKPLYLIPSSLFLGMILASGDVITVVLHLPMAVVGIFTGLNLYFLICGEFFVRYRLRWKVDIRRDKPGRPPPLEVPARATIFLSAP